MVGNEELTTENSLIELEALRVVDNLLNGEAVDPGGVRNEHLKRTLVKVFTFRHVMRRFVIGGSRKRR